MATKGGDTTPPDHPVVTDGNDPNEAELTRLRDDLESERRTSEQWRRLAEERRVAMETLRQRFAVRVLFSVARVVLPVARRWRWRLAQLTKHLRGVAGGVIGARHRLNARRREAALRTALEATPVPPEDSRSVTVIVLTHDGRAHLERLLPALANLSHPHVHVVVVDNGSGNATRRWLAEQQGLVVVRNESNVSFAAANDAVARNASTDTLLFLNDDVEPLDPLWLNHLLAELKGDVAAVGAQLVYPRAELFGGRQRDVSIQHLGIELEPRGDGPPRARNVRGGDPDPGDPVHEVAAATAGCLLVDRLAYTEVGGFDHRYNYGAEDVDLCWRFRQAGYRIVVAPSAVLWHREGATRHLTAPDELSRRQDHNWDLLADRFGPAMRRAVDEERLAGELVLSSRAFAVGITVTRNLEAAGYGDWYTAHELGDALEALGWQVHYLERYRDAWYVPPDDLDAIVVLHDLFDVTQVARPGLTTLAWVRNWTDRWVSHPWFDQIDIVVASSQTSAERILTGSRRRHVSVLPLATNAGRFSQESDGTRHRVALTANHWGEDRGIQELVRAVPELELYGKGWGDIPGVAAAWRGSLAYEDLPALYAESLVVVDQTAAPTRPYGALNSRVFDALAAGALVITDQAEGAAEVFGAEIPTYHDPESLRTALDHILADPTTTKATVSRLRSQVLEDHTYARRAQQLRDLIREHRLRSSFVVRIGAPNRKEGANWGDTFFADALARELRMAGHHTLVQTLDEWTDKRGKGFDVSLQLRGRSVCPRSEGQTHALWIISHPDEITGSEVDLADVVFTASESLAKELRRTARTRIEVLLQATDEARFRPRPTAPEYEVPIVFVGNSRFVERPIVRDALHAGLPLTVFGANWEGFVSPSVIAARFVPNDQVPIVYSSAQVVLNDHWLDMRKWGLVSNRIFDALACGACVVSDRVDGLITTFGDAVGIAEGPEDLKELIDALLADPDRRRDMGQRGREAVLAAHTFRHRVDDLLRVVQEVRSRRHGDSPELSTPHDGTLQ